MFSLEDDDYGDMFITQTPRNVENSDVNLDNSSDDVLLLGVEANDFSSQCTSIVKPLRDPQYSDISDTDDLADFDIPSSQK